MTLESIVSNRPYLQRLITIIGVIGLITILLAPLGYCVWNEYRYRALARTQAAIVNWLAAHEKEYPTASLKK